jgi:malonyl CoA-acyl carrier protein transacylase
LKQRLVEQITSPVRWSQGCADLADVIQHYGDTPEIHELAPGKVLKGLFRRIERSVEVVSHDQPETPQTSA